MIVLDIRNSWAVPLNKKKENLETVGTTVIFSWLHSLVGEHHCKRINDGAYTQQWLKGYFRVEVYEKLSATRHGIHV